MQRQRKRGAGNLPDTAQPAQKRVVNAGQKRIQALGTRYDPVVLLDAEGTPQKGTKQQRQQPASPQHLPWDSSSGQSADAHLPLNDTWLREARPDECAAAAAAAAAVQPPQTDAAAEEEVPKKVQVGTSATYHIHQRLGKGGFGQVYLGAKTGRGRATTKPARVAVKFELRTHDQAAHEWNMYKEIGECYGLGRFYSKGRVGNWHVMIMELLGSSLFDVRTESPRRFTDRMLACIAIEATTMLWHLHSRGYVHGDMKPENLVLGRTTGGEPPRLHLVDLGLTAAWRYKSGTRKPYDSELSNFKGTTRYASLHAHLGRVPMPRDDLESLAYSLIFLAEGCLPWQGLGGDEDHKRQSVAEVKASLSAQLLCARLPPALRSFTDAVLSLGYGEEPDYAAYVALFEPLATAGPGTMPLTLAPPSLRPEPLAWDIVVGPQKRLRQGQKSQQFLLVFNPQRSHKQRYHTGIDTMKLKELVTTGWNQKMHISSAVAAPDGRWNFIMDSGLGYTHQAYEVSEGLVSKSLVVKRWEEGFYITSIAGMLDRQRSLTVMSKGTPFTQQSYKVSDSFPFDWVKAKWQEGFYVTAAASAQNSFAVVMSKGEPFPQQVVEVDYAYPSEAIHQRWAAGFRITACASTKQQTAVCMSLPKREPRCNEQETLRTDQWPSAIIKEKWDKGMFIACMSYGRTLH